MSLQVGSRLGHYDVTALIGEGGMGQVYQATDTKLKRQVALKILPEAFSADPERLAGFQREAEVLASLNHPNIAAIHGLEESDGIRALVLELVEGPTLADRIKRGPIPLDEALPIAKQIAEALEAAHEAGVIHRDLKPANIKVKDDGTVKVLDFGLAKAFQPDASDPSLSQSPTISLTAAATQMGMVLGTAAYMAPEQASGKVVDKRADVWAFGVVLYEMLTGTRPFVGNDVSKTLARVIDRDPDWSALPKNLPPVLGTFLRGCLEKDPRERVRDIGDVRLAMKGAFEAAVGRSTAPTLQPASWRQALPPAIAASVIVGVVTGIAVWTFKASPVAPIVRFEISPAEPMTFPRAARALTLSPDGTRLVYEANQQLYSRRLDQLQAAPIRGSEGGTAPFFSPDGQWMGFFTGTQLKKVPINGGAPITLCDVLAGLSGTWGADGTIVYGRVGPTGLSRVSAAGGTPEAFSTRKEGEVDHDYPDFLPGGDAVLFTISQTGSWDDAQLVVQSLDTGERHVVLEGGFYGRFVPTGHLVYARAGGLMAVPFDLGTRRVTGDPAPIVEGVRQANSGVQFAFSDGGMLAYVPGAFGGTELRQLVWVDRNGEEEPIGMPPRAYNQPQLSPDGRRLVVDTPPGGDDELFLYDLETQVEEQFTFEAASDYRPIWSPDGLQIVFSSDRHGGPANLYVKPADGSGTAERLTSSPVRQWATDWADNGETLILVELDADTGADLLTLRFGADAEPESLLETVANELNPAISPNGRWMAYRSAESGEPQIYVRPFPDASSGGQRLISDGRADDPLWGPDGRELFYLTPEAAMVVPVETGDSFQRGTPQRLFSMSAYFEGLGFNWDISPNGRRFLMVKRAEPTSEDSASDEIIIVQNWFEELKRLVPVD